MLFRESRCNCCLHLRLYANIIGSSDQQQTSDMDDIPFYVSPSKVVQDDAQTLQAILQERSLRIDTHNVIRINVTRTSVFEGAQRAFKRSTYTPYKQMIIRFADDDGVSEGAVDQGGPLREFFRLLLTELLSRNLFCGPMYSRTLTNDARGTARHSKLVAVFVFS